MAPIDGVCLYKRRMQDAAMASTHVPAKSVTQLSGWEMLFECLSGFLHENGRHLGNRSELYAHHVIASNPIIHSNDLYYSPVLLYDSVVEQLQAILKVILQTS